MTSESSITPLISIDLLSKIIQTLDVATIVSDTNGNFLIWNDKADSIFKKEISRGADYKSAYKTYDLENNEIPLNNTALARALKGETVISQKYFIDGDLGVYIEVSSKPIFDNEGRIEAAVATFTDITKQQMFWNDLLNTIKSMEDDLKGKIGIHYEALRKKYLLKKT